MGLKKLARINALDLWICRHFKVLPTDARFKELTSIQKNLLFESFVHTPIDLEIYKMVNTVVKTALDTETKKALERAGYTPEQLKKIQENLETAEREGLSG